MQRLNSPARAGQGSSPVGIRWFWDSLAGEPLTENPLVGTVGWRPIDWGHRLTIHWIAWPES